jgi:hypothetical protein
MVTQTINALESFHFTNRHTCGDVKQRAKRAINEPPTVNQDMK